MAIREQKKMKCQCKSEVFMTIRVNLHKERHADVIEALQDMPRSMWTAFLCDLIRHRKKLLAGTPCKADSSAPPDSVATGGDSMDFRDLFN